MKALHDGDRYLNDDEIRAIAAKGGLIGIWPARALGTIAEMVRHIDHVKRLVGVDHLAIASDLRGMTYIEAFGEDANFLAIVDGLRADAPHLPSLASARRSGYDHRRPEVSVDR